MKKSFILLGQAFYAGGSERSGQQIIGPPKSRGDDNNVKKVFDAARKQGAREADDDDQSNSSVRSKNEKPFAGVGYSLGNIHSIEDNKFNVNLHCT